MPASAMQLYQGQTPRTPNPCSSTLNSAIAGCTPISPVSGNSNEPCRRQQTNLSMPAPAALCDTRGKRCRRTHGSALTPPAAASSSSHPGSQHESSAKKRAAGCEARYTWYRPDLTFSSNNSQPAKQQAGSAKQEPVTDLQQISDVESSYLSMHSDEFRQDFYESASPGTSK
jgi:hypothetical protein